MPVLDAYRLVTPPSLQDVLQDLSSRPGSRPFAGGTDLMVLLESGALPPGRYVSLSNCSDLIGIETDATGVTIGSRTTYTMIRRSEVLAAEYPMLAMAAAETGGVATQNVGTIGGNIANASPAADTPPALLAYDAELELLSAAGSRRLPYADFHLGYKRVDLRPGELIARVILPPRAKPPSRAASADRGVGPATPAGWRHYYRKVGARRAQAISKVCFAGAILMEQRTVVDVRIALGSVAPTPVRARAAEDALRGTELAAGAVAEAGEALASAIAPIDDIRSTAAYRVRVARNLFREFLGVA